MVLRFLHKAWQYFLRAMVVLLGIAIVGAGLTIGVIHIPLVQNHVLRIVEDDFNTNYYGSIEFERLDGFIPKFINLHNVRLYAPESDISTNEFDREPVAELKKLSIRLDLSDLLARKITITGLALDQPSFQLNFTSDSSYTLFKALEARKKQTDVPDWLQRIEILAPSVTVNDGSMMVDRVVQLPKSWNIPQPFMVDSVNTRLFLELAEQQRYMDVETFQACFPNFDLERLSASGQIFNDERFLEFNGFRVQADGSSLQLSGELEGVNLYERQWKKQFQNARFNASLDSLELYLGELAPLFPKLPTLNRPIKGQLDVEGRLDSLWINRLSVRYDQSQLISEGFVANATNSIDFNYDINLRSLLVYNRDIKDVLSAINRPWEHQLPALRGHGEIRGDNSQSRIELDVQSDSGFVALEGDLRWSPAIEYSLYANGSDVKIPHSLWPKNQSDVNFSLHMKGVGNRWQNAVGNGELTLRNSSIDGLFVDHARLQVGFIDGFLEPVVEAQADSQYVFAEGWLDFSEREPVYSLKGNFRNVDLSTIPGWPRQYQTKSSLNGHIQTHVNGSNLDYLYGNLNVIWDSSRVADEHLQAGYIDLALHKPVDNKRTLTVNSSLADMELAGNLNRDKIERSLLHWRPFLAESIKQTFTFTADTTLTTKAQLMPFEYPLEITGNVKVKDLTPLELLKGNPLSIAPRSELDFSLSADFRNLNADGYWSFPEISINKTLNANQFKGRFNTDVTFGQPLKDDTKLDLTISAGQIDARGQQVDSLSMDMRWRADSLSFSSLFSKVMGGKANARIAVQGNIEDQQINLYVPTLEIGNQEYRWRNTDEPRIAIHKDDRIEFEQFVLQNSDQRFAVDGFYSRLATDTLTYHLDNVQLGQISELIGGRVRFQGNVNGDFQTSNLQSRPYVEGHINVNQGVVNGNTVGDVSLDSRYNNRLERFDTQLKILTDTVKYSDYIDANNGNRTDIVGRGWFKPTNFQSETDTLYRMELDFNQIDGWVVNTISPNIFQETSGYGEGVGYITGNFQDFDFNADFQVDDLYGRPIFLNTNYYMSGHIEVDRNKGVVIDSVRIQDDKGGRGILYGSVDLNDFEPVKYMDIWLRMNQLRFLRTSFDRDVPFFGTVAGSGLLRVTGPNYNPFLRTVEPVETTSGSVLSIPLLEETELTEDRKFIQFVEEFDLNHKTSRDPQNLISESTEEEQAQKADQSRALANDDELIDLSQLTFTELFELDLQFSAPNGSSVELIFDQIAGEVLTANGDGQMQITLDDEVFQMFGRFNISGGEYQFVSGDIFTRRFFLEDGGSIQWEGDPYNARLNINTVYRARPTLSSLISATSQTAVSTDEQGQSRRVPIDLILEIRGTLEEVENNFFFRLPTSELEGAQNSALANQISLLNNEEQKLLQATSLLLTGNFLPITSGANQGFADLRENLSTGVVLSPLLSSQVNSLLKSNLSNLNLANNLDIDLNVTTFYELDLGIALRLFDDRLILRREGQITGVQNTNQSVLGDVGATYRINESLSVSYFHRQDQLFSTVTDIQTAQATQPLNGIGLEAQVQFNTWSDLKRRFQRTLNRIFGRKEKAIREQPDSLDGSPS